MAIRYQIWQVHKSRCSQITWYVLRQGRKDNFTKFNFMLVWVWINLYLYQIKKGKLGLWVSHFMLFRKYHFGPVTFLTSENTLLEFYHTYTCLHSFENPVYNDYFFRPTEAFSAIQRPCGLDLKFLISISIAPLSPLLPPSCAPTLSSYPLFSFTAHQQQLSFNNESFHLKKQQIFKILELPSTEINQKRKEFLLLEKPSPMKTPFLISQTLLQLFICPIFKIFIRERNKKGKQRKEK